MKFSCLFSLKTVLVSPKFLSDKKVTKESPPLYRTLFPKQVPDENIGGSSPSELNRLNLERVE